MLNTTSQVQGLRSLPEFRVFRSKEMSEELERIKRSLSGRYEHSRLFPKMVDAKREYPGEAAGVYLSWYLENMRPSVRKTVLKRMRPFIRFEKAVERKDPHAIERAQRESKGAWDALLRAALRGRLEFEGLSSDGLLVRPTTLRGLAACAVLGLFDRYRLRRMRRCIRCRAWFYARFKHQLFCNDLRKRCQWNHYHTPEWRKQHRERNRKHQQAFRERTFGTRRK